MNPEEAMTKEFCAAKIGWAVVLILQFAALLIALLAQACPPRWATVALGAGIVIPVLCLLAKKYAGDRYAKGETNRRLLVLADGWGTRVDPSVPLLITAETTALPSWDPPPVNGYFSSPHPPGPARVAHVTQQAAFFTTTHAGTAAALCWAVVVAGAVVGITLLWLVAHGLVSPATRPLIAQISGALLAFGAVSEFARMALAFGDLSTTARSTVETCRSLARQSQPDAARVAYAVGAYDCVLARCPPLPGVIYQWQRPALEAAWQSHEAKGTP